jgi:hypothetical protein
MNEEAKVASFHTAGHRVYTESVDMPITMEESMYDKAQPIVLRVGVVLAAAVVLAIVFAR